MTTATLTSRPKIVRYRGSDVCSNCGSHVYEETSVKGHKYLAEIARPSIHGGTFSPAHRCDLYSADDASLGFLDRKIAEGEIVVGQSVEVFKGRKVPVGTVGVIFWTGDSGYGESVGFTTAEGAKHFTALSNVRFYCEHGNWDGFGDWSGATGQADCMDCGREITVAIDHTSTL